MHWSAARRVKEEVGSPGGVGDRWRCDAEVVVVKAWLKRTLMGQTG